jgi:hypothetical protein
MTLNSCEFKVRPTLFPFENDLSQSLQRVTTVNVVKVVADRICVDRRRPDKGTVAVSAETAAEAIINGPSIDYGKLFSGSTEVTLRCIEDAQTFRYYNDRKIFLVNGLHFALATLAYFFLRQLEVPPKNWGSQYLPILLEALLSRDNIYRAHIKNYMDGQIMRLILEHGPIISKEQPEADDVEAQFDVLRSYGENILGRTRKHLDNLGRILDLTTPEQAPKLLKKFRKQVKEARKDITFRGEGIGMMAIRRRPFAEDIDLTLEFLTDCVMEAETYARSKPTTSPT